MVCRIRSVVHETSKTSCDANDDVMEKSFRVSLSVRLTGLLSVSLSACSLALVVTDAEGGAERSLGESETRSRARRTEI